jgi:hypothetical protein
MSDLRFLLSKATDQSTIELNVPAARAMLAERDALVALSILSMRVLQSDLVLDDEEMAARDLGIELHRAALAKVEQS